MKATPPPATVLIIDDVRLFSLVTAGSLRAAGYNVLLAGDGQEGLEMVRRHRPHVVLLDLMMPLVNGVEVLKAIRADTAIATTPVLVVSALSEGAMTREAASLGIEGRLLKSTFSMGDLLAAIGRVVPNPRRVTDVA